MLLDRCHDVDDFPSFQASAQQTIGNQEAGSQRHEHSSNATCAHRHSTVCHASVCNQAEGLDSGYQEHMLSLVPVLMILCSSDFTCHLSCIRARSHPA